MVYSNFNRCLWIVLVLTSFAFSGIQIYKQCGLFINPVVSTSIDFEYPSQMPFPSIFICNSNLYRISMAYKYKAFGMINSTYANQSDFLNRNDPRNMTDFMTDLIYLNNIFNTSTKFLKGVGHQIDDMLLDCSNIDGSSCSSQDFTSMYTDYGNCFIYNKNQTIMATQAGSQTAISFYINLEAYEYMAGPSELSSLKVLILNQTNVPSISQDAIDVAPGFVSVIGTTYHEEERLDEADGGTCVASAPMNYFPAAVYSIFTCQQDKLLSAITKNCSCFPNQDMPLGNNVQYCNTSTYFGCVLSQSQTIATKNQTCKEACKSNNYKTSLSLAKFPDKVMTTIQRDHGTKILTSFNLSMEAKMRTDYNLVSQMTSIISQCNRAISEANTYSLLPNQTYLPSNFVRLNVSSTFRNMVSQLAYFATVVNDKMSTQQNDMITQMGNDACSITAENLLNATESAMTETQQQIFGINSSSSITLAYDLFNAWNSSNWENFFSIFKENGLVYSTSNSINNGQNSLPWDKFNTMIGFISAYESGNLQKNQWADNNTQYTTSLTLDKTLYEQLLDFYANNLCNQFNVLENLKLYLIQFETDNITQLVFDNLNESSPETSRFWTVFTYAASAKFQINVTCGIPTQFCMLFALYSNVVSDAMSNAGFQSSQLGQFAQLGLNGLQNLNVISTTCYMPSDYTFYINLFKTLYDNKESLLRDVNKILNHKNRICDNMKSAFNNLNTDLKKYLTNWEWDNQFWNENVLGVKVFFSELSRETVSQSASYSVFSLICDIGGTLGLFLGASILTFFEVIDLLIWGLFCKNKGKKRQIKDQSKDVPMKVNAYYKS